MPARSVLMIEPNFFEFNAEAALDNAYMKEAKESVIGEKVMQEFDALVNALKNSGVQVNRFPSEEGCPDAVWPNNWFATLPNNQGVISYSLFPMKPPNRRVERKNAKVLEFLHQRYSHGLEKDWSHDNEENNRFLEGTGSLVLDHQNKIAYASISERTNRALVEEWTKYYNYKAVCFTASHVGKCVYHTNVIMAMGTNYVVVALDTIAKEYHEELLKNFEETNKRVISITGDQVSHFCGNILELENTDGKRVLAMSSQAFTSFTSEQKQTFLEYGVGEIVHSDISTLETIGGGSCRCMLAELF